MLQWSLTGGSERCFAISLQDINHVSLQKLITDRPKLLIIEASPKLDSSSKIKLLEMVHDSETKRFKTKQQKMQILLSNH